MKKYGAFFLSFLWVFLFFFSSSAQRVSINPDLLQGGWSADWITCPDIQAKAYGIYHFRKKITLSTVPYHFIVHVSADNRYHLFVNGKSIGRGPARSTTYNWNFGSYDLAPFLHEGENIVSAQVWNMGEYAPVAQLSHQTGFLLQGDTKKEEILNTNPSWLVYQNKAYSPTSINAGARLHSYVAVGAMEEIKGALFPWGWKQLNYDDAHWLNAVKIPAPTTPQGYGTDNRWTLSPREIPQMEEKKERMGKVARTKGIKLSDAFIEGKESVLIPAHSKVTVLIDQEYETVGYPVLKISRGKGAKITMTYAEALFDEHREKGNRNEIEGKKIIGLFDVFYPDGGNNRKFTTLWIRTWRYLQLEIETESEPLKLKDIYGIYSTYPFERKATFSSNDASLLKIWDVGWRTARLCAGETYFDCPYYEQLQYEGDTRIQALISYYNTGDDRLARKAIHDFYLGRVPNGLTQGRFPSNRLQIIPPYSLFWVSMVYDYWMHQPDTAFVKQYLDAARDILKWYEKHIDPQKGMLGPMKWWNFEDYTDDFPGGVPDGAEDGNSSVITLHYAYTLQQASKLFRYFDRKREAEYYDSLAHFLTSRTYQLCFNPQKMEMANQPISEKRPSKYSQHAGIMAILSGAIPKKNQQKVISRLLEDTSLSQVTFYFRFYLMRALIQTGNADLYYKQLKPWREMLDMGLTTFAEKPEPTRSDCHAWSASPIYDFLATICGITPDAPGFQKVKIAPALGGLKEVSGSMVLPGRKSEEIIKVHFIRTAENGGLEGEITLPKDLKGVFVWKGQELELHGGQQEVKVIN